METIHGGQRRPSWISKHPLGRAWQRIERWAADFRYGRRHGWTVVHCLAFVWNCHRDLTFMPVDEDERLFRWRRRRA